MGQMGEWIPGEAPLDEGYWEALLRDGENGRAAPPTTGDNLWKVNQGNSESAETPVVSELVPDSDRWQAARDALEQDRTLELQVTGCNRGGVLVGWNGLRGEPLSSRGRR